MGFRARLYLIDVGWGVESIGVIEGLGGKLRPEDVARLYREFGDKGIVAGFPGNVDPCQAILAALYVLEDEKMGNTRIKNRALRWVATMIGARQARDAVDFVKYVESVVVVGLSVDTETLVSRLLESLGYKGGRLEPAPYSCSSESLAGVTMKRVNLI